MTSKREELEGQRRSLFTPSYHANSAKSLLHREEEGRLGPSERKSSGSGETRF